jgi:6-phosphogluconolactonase/glucosamine-6-phosphate isomerase/deaminase
MRPLYASLFSLLLTGGEAPVIFVKQIFNLVEWTFLSWKKMKILI